MITQIIRLSLKHPAMVILLALGLALAGWQAMLKLPVDAIPDLSDVQVIVKTSYPGQSPEIVEQQVTYPLSNLMLAVPGAKAVRGYSFFGDSYLYIIFDDSTELYWARSRVLEYLNQAASLLPEQATPQLGPDASGVGWVYQYALQDSSGTHNLADLKALQDWFLKPELQAVAGVSEIATVGGMTQTYQVELNPLKLARYRLTPAMIRTAIVANNGEVGGSVIELAEAEYMLRAKGFLQTIDDFKQIPLGPLSDANTPLLLKDVASIRLGPSLRRGIAELNGQGEVVGGIVVMRSGENARKVITAVTERLEQLKAGLPAGVEIIPVYNRADFIQSAVDNLQGKLLDEMALVALVLVIFLWHIRSALVAVIVLPLSLLASFLMMNWLGISANIMSLGGIAIAIGALVDATIVMVENLHKHLEGFEQKHQRLPDSKEHWQLVLNASMQMGPALFFSLLLITVSFFPVFALEGQEGRLFSPLALTKSFAMAAAALFAVTLVPVLMGYGVKGKITPEQKNPISRLLAAMYKPFLILFLRWPILAVVLFTGLSVSSYYPFKNLGYEFLPKIDEGDLLYMPTTLPGISAGKAAQLLQQTDAMIKTLPEVDTVFGKVGRAETATDPAPLTMLETTIQLKPVSQWREGMTIEKLIAELQQRVKLPGVTNAWVQPIRTRIDMLSTGLKTPLGLKIAGDDFATIEELGQQVEGILQQLPETASVYAERVAGGRYIDIEPNLQALARYGINLKTIQELVQYAIGGMQVDQVIKGNERFPVNLRYPRDYRDNLQALRDLPVLSADGLFIPLSRVADISIVDGPAMIKSENARTLAWVFVDVQQVSVGEYLRKAQALLDEKLQLPAKYSISWTGQYEAMQRVEDKLWQIAPVTLMLILLLLYFALGHFWQSITVLAVLPVGLAGSLWALWYWQFDYSIAVAVGIIAMAGVAAEFGVVMFLYLNQCWQDTQERTLSGLKAAVISGAVQRIRPKAMTVLTIIIGLLPIMLTQGAGYEVMQRIALPMIGGMLLAPIASMLLIPVVFFLWEKRKLKVQQ